METASDLDQCFQILLVEDRGETEDFLPAPNDIKTTLVTRRRGEFQDYPIISYDVDSKSWRQDKAIGSAENLPTKGVEPDEKFMSHLAKKNKNLELAEYSTVRFLLQTRKVSQVIAKTWLSSNKFEEDEEWQKDNARYTRELLLSGNALPDDSKDFTGGNDKTHYIIKPSMPNYTGIRLSLLLAGQAYRWVEAGAYRNNPKGYLPICDSILSTYESVYEYSWQVSWDTFYASRIDIPHTGLKPKPPYYEVTLAYPPKPDVSEKTPLTEEKIRAWGFAKEDKKGLPFYPAKDDEGNYVSRELQYTMPPYPYLPMSCGC